MEKQELSGIARSIARIAKKHLDSAILKVTEEFSRQLGELSSKIKAIPAGPQGERGEKGLDGATGPQGEQGEPGVSIKGDTGLQGEPGPQGPRGEKGDTGVGESGIAGKDGEKGEKGDAGKPGTQGERGLVGEKGDSGAVGQQGERGEKGLDGKDGRDGREGKDGKDGVPGRDALELDILPMIEADKSYPRGTYARKNGGIVRSIRNTTGDPGDWEVMIDGLLSIDVAQSEDQRSFSITVKQTSGESVTKTFAIPALIYREIYTDGREYVQGDVVTLGGSAWHCQTPTKGRPGVSPDWKLMVKTGARGKDGKDGERGAEGPKGKDFTR